MRLWLIRLLLALLVPITAAQAQLGKPDALPPVGSFQSEPGGKPPPLPPSAGMGGSVAPRAPAAPQENGQATPQRCPQVLANGCLSQQSSCQIACPPQWSTNPSAPAFTPTDRAGCMGQCLQRYMACMRLHGCM